MLTVEQLECWHRELVWPSMKLSALLLFGCHKEQIAKLSDAFPQTQTCCCDLECFYCSTTMKVMQVAEEASAAAVAALSTCSRQVAECERMAARRKGLQVGAQLKLKASFSVSLF